MTTHAIGYARLSREGEDSSTSIAAQRRAIESYAQAEGLTLPYGILVDDGLSGGSDREKALRCLYLLRAGQVDVVLVDHADRWSRQGARAVADLFDVLDAIRDQRPEAHFRAVTQGLDSRAETFDVMFGISSVMARAERKATQRRVRRSIAERRAAGRFTGMNIPWGYASVPNPRGRGRILAVHSTEAAILREAASLVLAGASLTSVATRFNNAALLHGPSRPGEPYGADHIPRRGNRWSVSSLKAVLTGYGAVGTPTRVRKVDEGGRTRRLVEPVSGDDGMRVRAWEPALDVATWERVRAHLGVDQPPAERTQRRRAARLLSGILRCAGCNGRMHVRGDRHDRDVYYCSAQRVGGVDVCDGRRVSARLLDEHVEAMSIREHGDAPEFERREYAAVEGSTVDIDRALADLGRAFAEPGADVGALLARREALLTRQAELRATPRERRVDVVETGRSWRQAWEAADLDGRRAMLAANYSVLAVRKGKQGSKKLDPARLVVVGSPAFPLGAAAAEDFTAGTPAVEVEHDGLDGDGASYVDPCSAVQG